MADGFVKNYKLLEENSKADDLLNIGDFCEKFTKKLDHLQPN